MRVTCSSHPPAHQASFMSENSTPKPSPEPTCSMSSPSSAAAARAVRARGLGRISDGMDSSRIWGRAGRGRGRGEFRRWQRAGTGRRAWSKTRDKSPGRCSGKWKGSGGAGTMHAAPAAGFAWPCGQPVDGRQLGGPVVPPPVCRRQRRPTRRGQLGRGTDLSALTPVFVLSGSAAVALG